MASAAWAVIWVADTLGSRFTRTSARSGRRFANRLGTRFVEDEEGTASAEYAVVCLAAVAFGGVLYTVITGGSVVAAVTAIIQRALSVDF